MIGRVLKRGKRVYRLLCYLYSPGKSCLHSNPHLVSGWRHPAELEPPVREDGKRNFRRLTRLLEKPLAGLGDRAPRAEQEKAACGVTWPQQWPRARSEADFLAGPQLGKTPRPCMPGMTRGTCLRWYPPAGNGARLSHSPLMCSRLRGQGNRA
jgi:hypothetical protein